MGEDDDREDKDPGLILSAAVERLIEMQNRLGHELIAVQSVCAHLIARQCNQAQDPLGTVQEIVTLLSATGVALADRWRADGREGPYDTRGATDAFERIASMAEGNVLDLLGKSDRVARVP